MTNSLERIEAIATYAEKNQVDEDQEQMVIDVRRVLEVVKAAKTAHEKKYLRKYRDALQKCLEKLEKADG